MENTYSTPQSMASSFHTQWLSTNPSQRQQSTQGNAAPISPYPQDSSSLFSPTPTNTGAFDSNSRIPGLGSVFAPPPPMPAEVFQQFAISPLPPPPFPPVPPPQSSLSSIPGLGTEPSLSDRKSPADTIYEPPEPLSHASSTFNESDASISATREEGELSDGELEEDILGSESEPHSRNFQSKSELMGNTIRKEASPPPAPSLSDDEGSVSSYNPPSASSVEPAESSQAKAVLPYSQTSTMPSVQNGLDRKSPSEMRKLAKNAIISLMPHKITYKDLVQEGIDAMVLRPLYEELGYTDFGDADHGLLTIEVSQAPIVPDTQEATLVPATVNSIDVTPFETTNPPIRIEQLANPIAPKNARAAGPSATQPSVPANAALERKDRIAQLLAAKAAKTTSSQSPPAVSTPQKLNPVAPAPNQPASTAEVMPTPKKAETLTEEQSGKRKSKAQTELVRQKMEALKQQALAKTQSQKPSPTKTGELTKQVEAKGPATSVLSADAPEYPAVAMSVKLQTFQQPHGQASPLPPRSTSAMSSNTPAKSSQKRPLAADLFDEPTPPAKRPFGRKDSHGDVEIIVSEDDNEEDSDVGMDLEDGSEGEIRSGSEVAGSDESSKITSSARGIAFGADVFVRALGSSPPQSAVSTPMKEKGQDEALRARNDEIALMRKRIAEMEQRKKAKQSIISQGSSPAPRIQAQAETISSPLVANATPAKEPFGDGVTGRASAIRGLNGAGRTLSPTPGIPATMNAAARAEALRKRLIRRREIQAGIPVIDAEVERTKSMLAELQKKAQRLEAEIQKGLEGRQKLLRELESLGMETDSGSVDKMRLPELRAVRDELLEAQQSATALEPPTSKDDANTEVPAVHSIVNAEAVQGHVQASVTIEEVPSGSRNASSAGFAMDESSAHSDAEPHLAGTSCEHDVLETRSVTNGDLGHDRDASRATTALSPNGEISLNTEAMTSGTADQSDAGSVSMADSSSDASEAYEPGDSTTEKDVVSHIYDPETAHMANDEGEEAEEGNEYEPMDLTEQQLNEFAGAGTVDATHNAIPDEEQPDELTDSNTLMKPDQMTESVEESSQMQLEPQEPRFVPYKSALKDFRNYRFNPRFTEEVSGGYRSLTYSSKIDARKVLCKTEAIGETCLDPNCEDQHFAQMGLSDDKILVEMSSAPGMDKESRNRYVNGLKLVIADLRSRSVKEFSEVAAELAAYRRRFEASQDPLLAEPPPTNGTLVAE